MADQDTPIHNVSDTSLWVAYYRAQESERPDALFRDPLAKILVGERGRQIAEFMKISGRYTRWSVVTRTVIIDRFIEKAIDEGVDTILNLGAGMDTRPYRMELPRSLRWIEVDYPNIIQHKNAALKSETPRCQLTRVELDLAFDEKRRELLAQIASQSTKALVLTEGVIPYLTEAQVSALAQDLHERPAFQSWITEYFHADIYRHLKSSLRTQKMRNAPFRFYPDNWIGFFESRGWTPKTTQYIAEEALKQGRTIPMPWWAKIIVRFLPRAVRERQGRTSGYILFKKKT